MTDILVVGAGPVGLTLAAELARHGATCRIIDQLAQPTGYCKALGVTPRTLEVWEDMGIVRPMIEGGLWLTGLRLIVNGELVKEITEGLPALPYGLTLGLPQYETEFVLGEHARRLGILPERGTSLQSAEPSLNGVAVRLAHEDGRTEEANFRYVVGCDGAHSMVRKAAGIGFPGEAYPVEFMLGDVAVDWPVPRGVGIRAVQMEDGEMTGFLVAVPLPDKGRYRLTSYAPPELAQEPGQQSDDAHGIQAERTPPDLAVLQAITERLMPGVTLSDLRWSSIFRISMRLADAYRKGPFFLAGDAAHIHPPTGGQGMNTGIQDAYNLAWKLALVVRGEAPGTLLDSYEAERRPVGMDVLERTIAQTAAFRTGQTGGKRGSDTRLEDSQLTIAYRDSAWVVDEMSGEADGPAAGDRAPDASGLRRLGLGMPVRLFDLLRGTEHVLLLDVQDDDEAGRGVATASLLRHRFGRRVRCYGIVAPGQGRTDLPLLPLIEDADGMFAAAYGSGRQRAWVVRPDGHIGYRGLEGDGPIRYLEKVLAPA
ncbi:MAG TPA: FAD-dependent monooxygenase [Geminicoccus sp.]|jgi:2-polyprenyl-6-methoxyphenol hydroxylase-like FAD-dependent oxidoreductase|uniref:FAD-dependent monooxygenase n=1 Tax=Geminicoccus sp. TaxID=2024832 RepID=UPI002E34090D|nr:FAD-dependent monooxygenase [Geminicoccus sp.]HEX2529782.1 FAD-dependent monooxygenase [Geminicoccus sp.]